MATTSNGLVVTSTLNEIEKLVYHDLPTAGELLDTTENELTRITGAVTSGGLIGKDKIALRVGKVINRYKMAKHFILRVEDNHFSFTRDETDIESEAALDGIYVIRTSVDEDQMTNTDAVEAYKGLSVVERDFKKHKGH